MRPTTLPILITLLTATTSAIDTIARRASTCISYAITNSSWTTENNLTRRRVVYDTTKGIVAYDHEVYSLGWRWGNEKDSCRALTDNVNVFYNALVIPGGAYVVDSSENLGEDGNRAHECLLEKFRGMLAMSLNCTG
ncbi:hypothetical protein EJ02DRAFT_419484 [Clathrospora elynae]|uniref:Ecp2 effector protein domain-containing protein n=1 Tax=Clathrospora elynae TaxID=706981 RepID=A0A6A5T408_9PLEO|nr:hypothetical protein EJ02DRAFT_419484 [Clathrospora elynae]